MEPTAHSEPFRIAPILALLALAIGALAAFAFFAIPSRAPETKALAAPVPDPFAGLSLEAKAAIVVDVRSGKVLYEKNADAQLPLASLTKVMLALAVAEVLKPDTVITIPYYASGANGEFLSAGERWSVQDVIDFTLVSSSNSGAEILAAEASGTIRERHPDAPESGATLWRMNDMAKGLGLSQTYFLNVSGLDLSETQAGAYGSARDMARLFAYAAAADPSLFSGTASNGVLLTSVNGQITSAQNTNTAQGAITGLVLGKTGLTDLAGGNLAVVFDVGLARPVVAVVLGSSEAGRFGDIQKLVATAREALTATP